MVSLYVLTASACEPVKPTTLWKSLSAWQLAQSSTISSGGRLVVFLKRWKMWVKAFWSPSSLWQLLHRFRTFSEGTSSGRRKRSFKWQYLQSGFSSAISGGSFGWAAWILFWKLFAILWCENSAVPVRAFHLSIWQTLVQSTFWASACGTVSISLWQPTQVVALCIDWSKSRGLT